MKENDYSNELNYFKEKIDALLTKDDIPMQTMTELLNGYLKLATTIMYMNSLDSFTMKNEICRHAIDVLTETESEEAYDRVVEICSLQKDMIQLCPLQKDMFQILQKDNISLSIKTPRFNR